jgi:hypothetical protein
MRKAFGESMMDRVCTGIALAAAVGLAAVGIVHGTWAAGGSDSSCYALTAEAFASGKLQPVSALGPQVPWPDAPRTLAPTGFVPSPINPAAASPICAPGFSLLLAPFFRMSGPTGLFMFTPLAGSLMVWFGFLLGRILAGPIAGALSAVLIATSPIVLYQVVQPMNDVTTAALWLGVVTAIAAGRITLAGALCGLALLVRPNLVPLAVVAGLFVVFAAGIPNPKSQVPGIATLRGPQGRPELGRGTRLRRAALFTLAALPSLAMLLWLNSRLYGGPLRSGYGDLQYLFGFGAVPTNAGRYFGWLIETQTPFPLLALAAPFVVARDVRPTTWFALAMAGATWSVYLFYVPFEAWWYLRFLIPAVALMLTMASATAVAIAARSAAPRPARGALSLSSLDEDRDNPGALDGSKGWRWTVPVLGALAAVLVLFGVRTADARFAFRLQAFEQRFRSVGIVARDRLPDGSTLLAGWNSGAVKFHGGREIVLWETLDPMWLDRAVAWLDAHGHKPYIALERWEEAGFRSRFGGHAELGQLDWPPRYEIDRVVGIYDPADRKRSLAGERVVTEYLWPDLKE